MEKKKIKRIIKVIVTLLLCTYFITNNNMSEIFAYIRSFSYRTWIIVLFLLIAALIINSRRWNLLLKDYNFFEILQVNTIAGFYSMIMPGQLVSEGAKIVLLKKNNKTSISQISASILVDKIIGVLAVFLSGLIGVILSKSKLPIIIDIFFFVGFFGIILLFFCIKINKLSCFIDKILAAILNKFPKSKRIIIIIRDMINLWCLYLRDIKKVIYVFVYACVAQSFSVLLCYFIAREVGANIHIFEWFWIDAYVTFFLLMPISLGGIGVREGAFASALSILGIRSEVAIAISFGVFCTQIFKAIIGGAVFAIREFVNK